MTPETITSISVSVTGITQIFKSFGLPKTWNLFVVLILSALMVVAWAWSHGGLRQSELFDYISTWVLVATSAVGVFSAATVGYEQIKSVASVNAQSEIDRAAARAEESLKKVEDSFGGKK